MATILGDVQYSQNGTFTNPCLSHKKKKNNHPNHPNPQPHPSRMKELFRKKAPSMLRVQDQPRAGHREKNCGNGARFLGPW